MQMLPYAICKPIYERLGLEFWPEQQEIIEYEGRFPLVVGGERGGKSFTTAAKMLPQIIMLPYISDHKFFKPDGTPISDVFRDRPRDPHFVLFGPNYREPRVEFELLQRWLTELDELITTGTNKPSKPQDGPWVMVTKKGVVIQTWSMENPSSIRAVDLEGALCCEAGMMPYDGITRVQGRVSGTQGFVIYNGTLENSQKWYRDWALLGKRPNHLGIKSFSLPTWTNRKLFPGGINHPEIQRLRRMYSPDLWDMRVAAIPRPPRDRVLDAITEAHVRDDIVIPTDAQVDIWVDPGFATAYAVLFVAHWDIPEDQPLTLSEGADADNIPQWALRGTQSRRDWRRFFYIVDEFYEQGKNTRQMIDMVRSHPLWPLVLKSKTGVIDVAARGHRDSTESALEIWQQLTPLSWNYELWPQSALMERIRTSAHMFQFAISPKCKGLLAEAGLGEPVFEGMHHWKYPTDRDGHVVGETPKDAWNHSAKALGYGLLYYLRQVEHLAKPTTFSRLARRPTGMSYLRPRRVLGRG